MKPVQLSANLFERFYAGGGTIRAFRGLAPDDQDAPAGRSQAQSPEARCPEDWVGSATTVFGDPEHGLSRLPGGELLRDAVAEDPRAWLGPEHVDRFGATPALLTKLLDAGERLPVHLHPDRSFAKRWLDSPFGKTEAWLVLEAPEGAQVWLGFHDDVDRSQLARWVQDQDTAQILGALRSVPVARGDAILVPAGLPHAIGAGVFLAELQEPTDFSVLLEWDGFAIDGREEGHLGLGFDTALDAVRTAGVSQADVEALRGPAQTDRAEHRSTNLLPDAADPYFRADRVEGRSGDTLPAGFAVAIGVEGQGTLTTEFGDDVPIGRGDTILVPHAAGGFALDGDVAALVCRPPHPEAS